MTLFFGHKMFNTRYLAFWWVLACLLVAVDVPAQEWLPAEPVENGKDWVQLGSGEWVAGSIDLLRDLEMQFDSDDLDDLVIDWADIAAFRSPRTRTYVFVGNRVATGPAVMKDGVISVSTGSGVLEFRREDLLSIIESSQREIDYWSLKANVGLTARSGNTDQSDLNGLVKIRREAAVTQLNVTYAINFSELSGQETTNNQRGTGDINYFVSRRFYVTPLSAEIYGDKFQNIEVRTTVGAGAGYYFYRNGDLEWSVGVGGGYRRTKYSSVEAGQDDISETGAVVPSTVLEADLTSDIELDVNYTAQIGVPDAKETTHHATALLDIDLVGDIFGLSTSLTWDRVENPQPDANGNVPKRDDFRLALGFTVDL